MAEQIDIISQNTQSTVIAEYERETRERDTGYQSESDLERDFIAQLQRQGYEYLHIHSETELVTNLRRQLERLNDIEGVSYTRSHTTMRVNLLMKEIPEYFRTVHIDLTEPDGTSVVALAPRP